MKLKFVIFVLFILPAFIYSQGIMEALASAVTTLNGWALHENTCMLSGTTLKLKPNGFLRYFGSEIDKFHGFFYEGTIPEDGNRRVAIRFTDIIHHAEARKEFEMHYSLKAYKNETAERYGIPVVYFYGTFQGFILTAFTMFDMCLQNGRNLKSLTELDELILLKDFVFQSKYIHSLGFRHDHIRPENIMTRKHHSFLFGFNGSSKIKDQQRDWTMEGGYENFKYWKNKAIDDFKSFLEMFTTVAGKECFIPRYNIEKIKRELSDRGSGKIIKAFAEEVWPSNGKKKDFPNYNYLAQIIDLEMTHTMGIEPRIAPRFSWENSDAETSAEGCEDREIAEIAEPELTNKKITYPKIPEELKITKNTIKQCLKFRK